MWRNLTAGEIVGQLMVVRDDLGEWPAPGAPLADVVAAASRHRLVWVDLELPR